MENIIFGLFGLLFGCVMVFLNKPLARLIIASQNKFWGLDFGDDEVETASTVGYIVGIGLIIVGLLSLFRIIEFR
jgi:hypothetical protein